MRPEPTRASLQAPRRPRAVRAQVMLQQYAEMNRTVHAELVDAGQGDSELSASKQKLWQVESALCARIGERLRERAGRGEGGGDGGERADRRWTI